jgi:hypothetical protein
MKDNQITAPNAGGPLCFPNSTSLAARVGESWSLGGSAHNNMELITYTDFGRLRLRNFCGDEVAGSDTPDWEWMDGQWNCDSVGFTWFGRLHDMPNETGGLEVDLADLPEPVSARILESLHLPSRAGMTLNSITSILGQPAETQTFVQDRNTYEFKVGSAHPYGVSCTVLDDGGLIFVSVIREDVASRIQTVN